MGRSNGIPLRVLITALILLVVLTSCKRRINKKGSQSSQTNPGNIQNVTLVVPASGTSVSCYSKVELLVAFSTTSVTKPYDPDPTAGGMNLTATFTGPSGSYTVPGFYSGTDWRVRFSPMTVGNWTYTVSYQDSATSGTWSSGTLTCTASAYAGFAHIDGRYLRMTNGSIFFPVGHNTGWLTDVEQPALTDMAARGENLLAFWHATPWTLAGGRAPIENATAGVGNYNQDACTFLDGLVGRAETAGVYLQPTIWAHGELRGAGHPWGAGWWTNNGYSTICATPTDFFVRTSAGSDTNQWRLQKNLLRYLFARYGYSRAILNWIVIAEIDGTSAYVDTAGGPATITTWLQAVRDYWNGMDVYRLNGAGRTPLAAFATDWQGTTGALGTGAGYDADVGLRSTDSYTRGNGNAAMAPVAGNETTALYQASAAPVFHGEIGGQALPIDQPQVAHDGLWSCISAGACMTPMQWTDGGTWVLLTQSPQGAAIRNQLQCVGAFMAGISYLGDPTILSGAVTAAPFGITAMGWSTHTTTQGFAWIRTSAPCVVTFGCAIGGLDDGTYSVQWYDVITGSSPSTVGAPGVATCTGGILTIIYPTTGLTSLACKFDRTGAAPPAPTISSTGTMALPGAIPPPFEGEVPPDPIEVLPPSPPGEATGSEGPPTDPQSGNGGSSQF